MHICTHYTQIFTISGIFPAQTGQPELLGPTIYENSDDAFYFTCKIKYPVCDPDSSARFRVTFWASDENGPVTICVSILFLNNQSYQSLQASSQPKQDSLSC